MPPTVLLEIVSHYIFGIIIDEWGGERNSGSAPKSNVLANETACM